ncbi:hypothetical protein [Mesoplasma melaleucae]|uniref:Uncharacterized protein n=1 Tax=Mesoplasma melaleucae TaxID=81459 RepID=A0A2K8NWZ6_9MOLU|nr:hypothetical protein [Mesoplasma melaleucae]ATZ18056.1 hypothetical protein EMELA_v1c05210 [Mesoplasma melaleucae]
MLSRKITKNKYKNYWIEFQDQNSNLSWFEPIKIDLISDFITLDIKEKYVVKITLDDLKINDLQSLKLKADDTKELFIILKQSKPVSLIKKEVELFCESKND